MTRSYAEPIDVQRRDTAPGEFLWRGRLYVVRAILAHWVESGSWWRQPAHGLDDGDREYWRVEAGCGRAVGTGVYDVCFDTSRGAWTIARVLD